MSTALRHYWHKFIITTKRLRYRHGEPYRIGGKTLRYVPGTRPVRIAYADSADVVARYDALQIIWLWSRLSEGDVAIDIGAHAGVYTLIMAAKCGIGGRVIAFEPDPHARELLAQNIGLNPELREVTVEARACSDEPGISTLFSRGGDTRSALVSRLGEGAEQIEVPLVTLDGYLAEHRLSPRCVKIDTEGAEIRILKGATHLLASASEIICELHPFAWKDFGNTFEELKTLIADSGRRMHYLDSTATLEDNPRYGTVVFEPSLVTSY